MPAFSKKQRDLVMRILCDFYLENPQNYLIQISHLHEMGVPQDIDANQIIEVLKSMGYVEISQGIGGPRCVSLTASGKCYFERKMDLTAEKRVERIRYIITTAIAVLALVLAAISLAAQLGLIKLPPT